MSKNVRVSLRRGSKPARGIFLRGEGETEGVQLQSDGRAAISMADNADSIEIFCSGEWRTTNLPAEDGAHLIVNLPEDWPQSGCGLGCCDRGQGPSIDLGPRYAFDRFMGEGGMGEVVKARDELLGRDVAVKLLNNEFTTNPEAQQLFLKEAQSLALLSHPNLVAVHDIADLNGRVAMVMEFVEGENLETMVDSKRLSFGSAVRIGIETATVLAFLHKKGLIHRDIKPANIMVRDDGVVKLIDFGLARVFDELAARTTMVRGTPGYMSPEQFRGETPTFKSDIYQLGATLFEMFAGRLPFMSNDLAAAHLKDSPPDLHQIADVPVQIADLVGRCLKKDPDLRPFSAEEIADQLHLVYLGLDEDQQASLRSSQTGERFSSAPALKTVPRDLAHSITDELPSRRKVEHDERKEAAAQFMQRLSSTSSLPPIRTDEHAQQDNQHHGTGEFSPPEARFAPSPQTPPSPVNAPKSSTDPSLPKGPPKAFSQGVMSFEQAFEDGISALLVRDFENAIKAFVIARRLKPTDGKTIANLARLGELGHDVPAE